MKNILFFFGLFAFVACSTKDDPGDVIANEFERITTVITKDSWKIGSLVKDGDDLTQEFREFSFTFDPDGQLSIEKNSITETGSWFYKSLPFEGELLDLDIDSSPPLDILSGEWQIESVINTQVDLFIQESDSKTKLVFERI